VETSTGVPGMCCTVCQSDSRITQMSNANDGGWPNDLGVYHWPFGSSGTRGRPARPGPRPPTRLTLRISSLRWASYVRRVSCRFCRCRYECPPLCRKCRQEHRIYHRRRHTVTAGHVRPRQAFFFRLRLRASTST
jgi:hypothetical protein